MQQKEMSFWEFRTLIADLAAAKIRGTIRGFEITNTGNYTVNISVDATAPLETIEMKIFVS